MTLEELSRLVLCVREIKDEEEGLSLTYGLYDWGSASSPSALKEEVCQSEEFCKEPKHFKG